MSYTVLGTCSICGGKIIVPKVWLGLYPPTPSCMSCGAVPKDAHGPVIPMEPRKIESRRNRILKTDGRTPNDMFESMAFTGDVKSIWSV